MFRHATALWSLLLSLLACGVPVHARAQETAADARIALAAWEVVDTTAFERAYQTPDPGPGLFWGIGVGHHWLGGQMGDVFEHGGLSVHSALGLSWDRWTLSSEFGFHDIGSQLDGAHLSRYAFGLTVSHRVMLSPFVSLIVGVGSTYNVVMHCEYDGADECDVLWLNDRFKPQGPGFHLDVGLAWTLANVRTPQRRARWDVISTLRINHLWLDNAPADRTIQGDALVWLVGSYIDVTLN